MEWNADKWLNQDSHVPYQKTSSKRRESVAESVMGAWKKHPENVILTFNIDTSLCCSHPKIESAP